MLQNHSSCHKTTAERNSSWKGVSECSFSKQPRKQRERNRTLHPAALTWYAGLFPTPWYSIGNHHWLNFQQSPSGSHCQCKLLVYSRAEPKHALCKLRGAGPSMSPATPHRVHSPEDKLQPNRCIVDWQRSILKAPTAAHMPHHLLLTSGHGCKTTQKICLQS